MTWRLNVFQRRQAPTLHARELLAVAARVKI
jgi:hypothetical protein